MRTENRNAIIGGSQSYRIGLKPVYRFKCWEFVPHEVPKIILCEVRFNLHEVRLNIKKLENLRKLEFFVIL